MPCSGFSGADSGLCRWLFHQESMPLGAPRCPPPNVLRGRDVALQAQTLCCLLSLEIPSPLAASPSSLVSIQEGRPPPTKRCSPCRRSEWPICRQLRSRGESPPELQQRGQRPPPRQGLGFYSERWLCSSCPVENLPVAKQAFLPAPPPSRTSGVMDGQEARNNSGAWSNKRCSRALAPLL